VSSEYVVNGDIRSATVRLIGSEGEQMGVFPVQEALRMARASGLDLLQVADKSEPPVCKIIDFGKFKYEQTKKAKAAAKLQRANSVETKEIQLRPVTDVHDVSIKAKRIVDFLNEGDKVKISIRFQGREVSHADMGYNLLNSLLEKIGPHKVDKPAQLAEKNLTIVVAPQKV
jgi:translation initiation factor IF-3